MVGPDQVDRELSETSDEATKARLVKTLKLCKEKYFLTRFDSRTKSRKAARLGKESGINLSEGARFMTPEYSRKIKEYIAYGITYEEKRDLEVLATVAIAGVKVFVSVDYGTLLKNDRIKDFVKKKDDIEIYRPNKIVELLYGDSRK